MIFHLQVSYYFQLAQQHQQQLQQNSGSPTQAQQVSFLWISKIFHILFLQPQSQPQPQQQAQVVQSGASGCQTFTIATECQSLSKSHLHSVFSGGVQTITVNQQQPQVIQLQPQQQQQPQPQQQQAQAQQQMQPGAAAGPPGGATLPIDATQIAFVAFFLADYAPCSWLFSTEFYSQESRLYSRSSLPLGRSTRFLYSWMLNSYR